MVAGNLAVDNEMSLKTGRMLSHANEDEVVVISGLAGTYPESINVDVFAENLFAKKDLVTDDDRRWTMSHPEIPKQTGKIPEVSKFDPSFFGIHYNQARYMDSMCRLFLEKAVEAVFDSGTNPRDLNGTRTGVYVGACFSESEKVWFYEKLQSKGFAVTGCSRGMIANRVAYYLGLNGPNYTIDTACSSSMYALENAFRAIRLGHCDAAIVGGCNLCLHPFVSLQFARLGVLSPDGSCKVFDEDANGYCRSESVCAVYLQKKKDARRIYASVIHAKTNCDGFKDQGITYPSGEAQQTLLKDFYEECEVDPSTITWIEAHGTGTKVGDPEEVRALVSTFCKGRKTPLKIGSVKSNIGHTEPSSGLCSITKVLIAMETGVIPPNIHFNTPRKDIAELQSGMLQVVTEPTPWKGGLVGVNSFGFGGANCHALFQSHSKEKMNGGIPEDDLPRLINIAGRTQESLEKMLDNFHKKHLDGELVKLYHDIFKSEIPGYYWRGFTIVDKQKSSNEKTVVHTGLKKRLILFFPGSTNSFQLDPSILDLPVIRDTLTKLSQVVKTDLIKAALDTKSNNHDLVTRFMITTAMQIAILDLLKYLNSTIDEFYGVSIGEIACAYAKGAISATDAILSSASAAKAITETQSNTYSTFKITSPMAKLKGLLSNDVDTIRIDDNECLIVGPKGVMDRLKGNLKAANINLSDATVEGYPLHSSFSRKSFSSMKDRLSKIFSASNPGLPEHFAHSLTEPIPYQRMKEEFNQLDVNVCEIGPFEKHPLWNSVGMNMFENEGTNSYRSLLTKLGKLFIRGVEMDASKLYPTVSYPVSRGTPMISPHIGWNHTEDWGVVIHSSDVALTRGEKTTTVSLLGDEYEFVSGHVIDGRNLFPATGYLLIVWETHALSRGVSFESLPVVFDDVRLNRATNISKDGSVSFTVVIQKTTGLFEVMEGGAAVVTGRIRDVNDVSSEFTPLPPFNEQVTTYPISSKDVYKELRLRGYNYKGLFRSVIGFNSEESAGKVQWHENWVAFMDCMLQMKILLKDTRGLYVPTAIEKVTIDPKTFLGHVKHVDENDGVVVRVNETLDVIQTKGIEIFGLRASAIARRKVLSEAVLERHLFIPYQSPSEAYSLNQLMRIFTHTVLENTPTSVVKVIEVEPVDLILSPDIAQALSDLPLIQPDITIMTNPENPLVKDIAPEITIVDKKKASGDGSALILVLNNATQLTDPEMNQTYIKALKTGGFVIVRCAPNVDTTELNTNLIPVAKFMYQEEQMILLKKEAGVQTPPTVVRISNDNFSWIATLQSALQQTDIKKIILVAQGEPLSGILGLFNCLRKEADGMKLRAFFIVDNDAPEFSTSHPFYAPQLEKDLAVNVYKDGQWGSYKHLLLESKPTKSSHVFLHPLVRGDLNSLTWIQGSIDKSAREMNKGRIVKIAYSSLNFRDVMLASGKLSPESITSNRLDIDSLIGFEYCGVLEDSGRRVMGLSVKQGLSSEIFLDPLLAWDVPDEWTLEDAATVPVVYATVIVSLCDRGKIKKGDTVLIHAGSGGVGLAAINVCLFFGCTVYTTVGTPEKREFILKTFPQLTERNIANSRDTTFEQHIMRETNGRGVDFVLNSLAEEKLLASVRCLAKGGKFLEIGKYDLSNNNPLDMELFLRGASFQGVMLDVVFTAADGTKERFHQVFTKMLNKGAVKPLCRHVFNMEDAEKAFRFMAAGKHIGKVILKIHGNEIATVPRRLENVVYDAKPRFYCEPNQSYIIAGGLGGFGLELADWLVLRGAKKLVLTSRHGISNGYQSLRIQFWKNHNVKTIVSTKDITTSEGVEELLHEAMTLGPVAGIFNLAAVLKDAAFMNQNIEIFMTSVKPKALATQYLDMYSRKLCPNLKHFVVFSSVSCGRGNGGQTNYGFSNSVMERICEERRRVGLPGVAIQWGAVGDVGLLADKQDESAVFVIGGTLQQKITSCLECMDNFLTQDCPVVASMVVAEKKPGHGSSDNIVDTVVDILGLKDLKNVSLHSTLAELGMDSMMAVEIKQTLEREFEVFLSPQDIRALTFSKLYEISSSQEGQDSKKKETTSEEGAISELAANLIFNLLGSEPERYEPIVKLPSMPSESSEIRNTVTILAPGLEGLAAVLEPIGEKLITDVYCMQFNYNILCSIEDEVNYLYPLVKEKLVGKTSFVLIGYSFGGFAVIKMFHMLESEGYKGRLILLDSSPFQLGIVPGIIFKGDSKIDQYTMLMRIIDVVCPQCKQKAVQDLADTEDWDERLDKTYEITKNFLTHTKEFQKKLFNAMFNRVFSILSYKNVPNNSIKAPVILIKPTENTIGGSGDFGLSRLTQHPVEVYTVEGNHRTMLDNPLVPSIINATAESSSSAVASKTHLIDTSTHLQTLINEGKQIQ